MQQSQEAVHVSRFDKVRAGLAVTGLIEVMAVCIDFAQDTDPSAGNFLLKLGAGAFLVGQGIGRLADVADTLHQS